MVSLTDRLDAILGEKASRALDDVFGIRTVDDLLRHYPRKYSQGMTVLGEEDEAVSYTHLTLPTILLV